MTFHNSALARLVPDGNYRAADLARIEAALTGHRTLTFVRLSSGLYSASSPLDAANRPHVRFDGRTLSEIGDERWAHAQNDALGYFLWLSSTLAVVDAGCEWRVAA